MLKENSVLLFQGDSVTDAGRTYDASNDLGKGFAQETAKLGLGFGYPLMIHQYLAENLPQANIAVRNRAISGHRTIDLKNRWESDTISLKPDYLAVLIGINDTWRRYDSNDKTTTEFFEANYRFLLEDTAKKLDCQFILLEPFIIPTDKEKLAWFEDLSPKIEAIKRLAKEFNAIYIPLQSIFEKECVNTQANLLSPDGVHPSVLGHQVIAKSFIDTIIR